MIKMMILIGSIFCALNVWALSPIDSGRFSLTRPLSGAEFTSSLLNYKRFSDEFMSDTNDPNSFPCTGWAAFEYITPTHIDMCSVTVKLSYKIQIILKVKANVLTDGRCLSKVNYSIQIMPGTRPAFLSGNVQKLDAEFCQFHDGKTVNYNFFITEGPSTNFMYRLIVGEFKKFVPDMIKTVQALTK